MPVPKRKRSHSRIAKAHANKRYFVQSFNECSNCAAVLLPHQACKECGYYKGSKVLRTKAERSAVRGKTRKEKADRAQARQQAAEPQQASQE